MPKQWPYWHNFLALTVVSTIHNLKNLSYGQNGSKRKME